ncbi:hypothetical protein SMD11_1237 [Streptomyces albireticuli]|uniref:Uncharacterized protein n=1 Tax=Streptomyces albireticuli TaxID=1940 RepID=A0A1Z2KXY4_9ACTN|nr:hypothetical protein SMD11_1237 [Streptomyces albireticuli]
MNRSRARTLARREDQSPGRDLFRADLLSQPLRAGGACSSQRPERTVTLVQSLT